MKLTDTQCRNAKTKEKTYKLTDGNGLYLEVRPNGTKHWRYRYRIAGKENLYAVGLYPETSLADARAERGDARELVKQGIHPAHHRKIERIKRENAANNTLKAIAQEWMESRSTKWSPKYRDQVERMLEQNAYPQLGRLPIQQIEAAQLLEVIKKVEARGANKYAILLRQTLSQIYDYAIATLRAEFNIAQSLRGAITVPRTKHHPYLKLDELPDFIKTLEGYGGQRQTVLALQILMRLFVRPVELYEAPWEEFHLKEKVWRIPAERIKMREDHIVPLSDQVLDLLEELQQLTGHSQWLFPNTRRPREPMGPTTLNRALQFMGYKGRLVPHGFRGTASTILHEQGWSSDVIERQLAHAERNKVRAAYNHASYLKERTEMMQAWSDFLDGLNSGENVVPIRAAANGWLHIR